MSSVFRKPQKRLHSSANMKFIIKFKVTDRNRWIDKYAQIEPNFLKKTGKMSGIVTERMCRIAQFNFDVWILASLMTYSSFCWRSYCELRIQHGRAFCITKKMPSKSIKVISKSNLAFLWVSLDKLLYVNMKKWFSYCLSSAAS